MARTEKQKDDRFYEIFETASACLNKDWFAIEPRNGPTYQEVMSARKFCNLIEETDSVCYLTGFLVGNYLTQPNNAFITAAMMIGTAIVHHAVMKKPLLFNMARGRRTGPNRMDQPWFNKKRVAVGAAALFAASAAIGFGAGYGSGSLRSSLKAVPVNFQQVSFAMPEAGKPFRAVVGGKSVTFSVAQRPEVKGVAEAKKNLAL